jgi:two-component system sensor histidine kinase HydH
VLGATLLANGWINRTRIRDSASALTRGQGEDLLGHLRGDLRGVPLDSLPLDSLLEQYGEGGLRWVGVFGGNEGMIADAGEALGPRALTTPDGRRLSPDRIFEVGGRYRAAEVLGSGPGGGRRGGGRPPGPSPDSAQGGRGRRGGQPDGGRPPLLVIEYEPVTARQLARQADDAFLLSAIVTALLLGVALAFWRLSVRHEQAQRQFEQQRRLGMLGEMSAVLAHEIRNPLASLKGNAQLLAERLTVDGPDKRKAERIVQEAQRLESLTTDLLDFARSGPIDVRAASPRELLESSIQEVEPEGFVVSLDGVPAEWPLDAKRVRQALTNVLRNAYQASPAGQRPEVAVGEEADGLVFSVRDFGPGISQGDEKRIFSPFFTTRTTGTGLGLAVAQRVVEMHEGSIAASNHPAGGAVFRLTFPRR